jgi:hypothetical protein
MNPSAEPAASPDPARTGADRPVASREVAALRVPTWAGLLLIVALWLIVRPYRGVRHDGVIYLGQTLGRLMPDTIGRDLFLAYGSQDRYSIYSPIMAPLVQHLGVGLSQIVVLFVVEALFILACWKLTSELSSRFLRWCAMLSMVSLPHIYGGGGVFAFAEPFLTARAMCEPLVVMTFAFLLRDRIALAAACMLAAILVHPLIALPGLAAGWIYLVLRDRRWLWALLALAVAGGLGACGMAPFDALWRRFDPAWFAAVRVANSNAFIASTTVLDWAPTVFDAGMLILTCRQLANSGLSRLIRAVLILAAVSVVLWGVGADLLHNVLITQLQLWRTLWLTHFFAVLYMPVVLVNLWGRGPVGRWAACAIVFAAVAVGVNLSTGWLCVVWAGLSMVVLRSGVSLSPRLVRLATIASVIGVLLVTAIVCHTTIQVVSTYLDRFNGASSVQVILGTTACCALVGFVVLRGLASTGVQRGISMAAVVLLSAGALSCWDQRSDWQRFVENGFQESNLPFAGDMPPNAKVYWDETLFEAWMLTHRPEFFADEQSVGLLFNRATAMAFTARRNLMMPLKMKKELCRTVARITGADTEDPDTCVPALEEVKEMCAVPGGPDILVFRASVDHGTEGATATWTFEPDDPTHRRSYRLYDCKKLK